MKNSDIIVTANGEMTVGQYLGFMENPANIRRCADCPSNMGMASPANELRLPCGQYHCWVARYCQPEKG